MPRRKPSYDSIVRNRHQKQKEEKMLLRSQRQKHATNTQRLRQYRFKSGVINE